MYETNLNGGEHTDLVLKKYSFLVRIVSKTDTFMFVFWGVYSILVALYMFAFTDNWVTFLPFSFPYLNFEVLYGWLITNLFQLPEICFVVPGILMHDILFIILVLNIRVLSGIIQDRIRLLDELLSDPSHTTFQTTLYLRNIIQMQKEMIMYVEEVQ